MAAKKIKIIITGFVGEDARILVNNGRNARRQMTIDGNISGQPIAANGARRLTIESMNEAPSFKFKSVDAVYTKGDTSVEVIDKRTVRKT